MRALHQILPSDAQPDYDNESWESNARVPPGVPPEAMYFGGEYIPTLSERFWNLVLAVQFWHPLRHAKVNLRKRWRALRAVSERS